MKFDLNQEYTFAKEIVDNEGIAVCKDYITITTSNEKNSKGQIFARVKQCFDGKEDTYSNCHVPLAKPNKMIVNGTAVTLEEQNGNSIITACEEPYRRQLAGLIKQENTSSPSKASDVDNSMSKLVKNMLENLYTNFSSLLTNIQSGIYSALKAVNPLNFMTKFTTSVDKPENENVKASSIPAEKKADASNTSDSASNNIAENDNTATGPSVTI